MKTVVMTEDVPEFLDRPIPEAGAGELVVRVAAAAVNPIDVQTADGLPRRIGWTAPDAVLELGWDFAGEVVATAPDTSIAAGTTVAGLVPGTERGSFAEYVAVPEAAVAPVPKGLDVVAAGSVPLNTLTAAQAVDLLGEPDGELLVTGAAGAVGLYAVTLAARAGWRVAAYARPSDREVVLAAGAASAPGGVGDGYAAVLDAAALGDPAVAAVADGGVYVGVLPSATPTSDRVRVAAVSVVPDGARTRELLGLVADGVLAARVRSTVPLERFADALEEAGRPGGRGRVVLTT
ncbi:zinc-binding dehydrogenase [Tsukamurella sp. 8F]|uniref:alcohol dehydrogenase catalytic domain-containing protein n=1 Tax=Tsukamurella sp. 8F TaxID=3031961 RepID=UPI0023B8C883|nr:zinc-binding dehydrogenase [Tsukamurella sp. 8F]MDF0586086.1 zinc-binding dehydrogenase [Tsukamurella sp. 8F]